MNGRRWWMVVALLSLGACRDDREVPIARDSTLAATPLAPVELTVSAADTLGWGQTDSVRLTLINRTTAPVSGVVWLSIAAPALLDSAGADSADASGRRVRLTLPAAAAGGVVTVAHALRLPPAPLDGDSAPRAYPVRAELAVPALVREDTVYIRPGSERVSGGCATPDVPRAQRFGVGPLRIGMSERAVRAACPEARDSSWEQEGTAQRGLQVRVGGVPLLAEVAGDSVWRIQVADRRVSTAAGVGVGTSLADLRARYGVACAGEGDGPVFVWFQNAPGISFALDSVSTRGWSQRGQRLQDLPDSARVDGFAVHGLDQRCPAR